MALICVTGPTVEPVSLDEVKAHCRIDIDDDDVLLAGLIAAARELIEDQARPRLALLTQTWRYVADAWPAGDTLELRPYPLQSVTSIKYTDENAVETTYSSASYLVDTTSAPGRLRLKSSATWPSTTLRELNGLAVEFVAGFGNDASSVPQRLRQALLLLVAHWYENRETAATSGAVPQEMPFAVGALLQHYRREIS